MKTTTIALLPRLHGPPSMIRALSLHQRRAACRSDALARLRSPRPRCTHPPQPRRRVTPSSSVGCCDDAARIMDRTRLQRPRSLNVSSSLWVLCLFVIAGPSFAADSGSDLMTLEQALAIALEHSPRLRAQDAAVSQARGAVREARSAGLPNASLQPGVTVQGPQAAIRIPHGPSETVQPGQTGQVGVSGQIPLDLNGRVRASTRAARSEEH